MIRALYACCYLLAWTGLALVVRWKENRDAT